jgi:hypothetical protein
MQEQHVKVQRATTFQAKHHRQHSDRESNVQRSEAALTRLLCMLLGLEVRSLDID